MSWGYHLMLDCSKCIPYTIRNKNNIILFAKTLVKNIDMVIPLPINGDFFRLLRVLGNLLAHSIFFRFYFIFN